MEIINKIGDVLNKLYPDLEVYVNDIVQGGEEPCFILQFVSKRDITIAGIKCNKAYTLDIVYLGKEDLDIYRMMDNLDKNLSKELSFMNYEIEIIDKEGHFTIEMIAENPKTKDIYEGAGFYKLLAEVMERLSKKICYFLTVDLQRVDFEKGFFVIKPVSLETSTISLNHRKEYEHEIELIYFENSTNHPMKVLEEHENLMEQLAKDLTFRKQYINFDYEIHTEEEEEEKYYAEVACFATKLTIQRR